jgi:uncharacterized LabA/DUF88 family protein
MWLVISYKLILLYFGEELYTLKFKETMYLCRLWRFTNAQTYFVMKGALTMIIRYNAVGSEIKNYLFVDGGAFRSILKSISREYFNDDDLLSIIDFEKMSSEFTKVFYYDCYLPEKDTQEYQTLLERQIALFNKMRRASGFHVIEGITRKKAKRNEQKGVDVNIAVDMLMHTYRKNMDNAYLLTGDADFIPLVKALVNEGMYVTLIYDKKSTSNELLLEVDDSIVIDYEFIREWIDFNNSSKFKYNIKPNRVSVTDAGLLIDKGYIIEYDYQDPVAPRNDYQGDDSIVNIYKNKDVYCLDIPYSQYHNYVSYFSNNLNYFRFYLDYHGIEIKWEEGMINK